VFGYCGIIFTPNILLWSSEEQKSNMFTYSTLQEYLVYMYHKTLNLVLQNDTVFIIQIFQNSWIHQTVHGVFMCMYACMVFSYKESSKIQSRLYAEYQTSDDWRKDHNWVIRSLTLWSYTMMHYPHTQWKTTNLYVVCIQSCNYIMMLMHTLWFNFMWYIIIHFCCWS